MRGLKQNRWPLAWVEQSHLSNLSMFNIWWAKRTLHSRDLMAPPPPPPPQMESLNKRQWSQEWILSFLIHETGLIEKPSYKQNLNRALLINLRQPHWTYKKCYWMPPYITVSYTNLSTEVHLPTPRHGQYITHAFITPAVAAMDSCLIAALARWEEETENELHQASLADVCGCRQLLFRYSLP